MNYIVLDLEWNQGNEEKEKQLKELPFEIIEIGAIRLNGQMEQSFMKSSGLRYTGKCII